MTLVNKLREALIANDTVRERSTIEEVLCSLGFSHYEYASQYEALLMLTATDTITHEAFLIAVWRTPKQSVTAEAMERFAQAVQSTDVSGGIIISVGPLNARKAVERITSKPVILMGEKELTRRLASSTFFDSTPAAEPSLFGDDDATTNAADNAPLQLSPSHTTPSSSSTATDTSKPTAPLTPLRNRSKLMRVTFPDGTVFCDKSTSQTFIQAVRHIGIERVADVGLVVAHCPLITRTVPASLAEWSKPLDDSGWHIILQSDTDQRHRQLLAINNRLELGMKIEVGNFDPITVTRKKEENHKTKSRLEITLPDGFVINEGRAADSYVSFMKHIGLDKLVRLNLKLSGKSLLTSTKQYSDQISLTPTRWLTVPTSNKLKYRAIKVVASMAHLTVEVKIV